jgi:hypothetical protein
MTTFHLFPLLPLELRIQIWTAAIPNRVLTIRRLDRATHPICLSPTPPPALMHACQESRKYAGYHYRKHFTMERTLPYLWANMSTDTVHINDTYMLALATGNQPRASSKEKDGFRHLQVEIDVNCGVSYIFSTEYRHKPGPDFPALETCDVIVRDGLSAWARIARENRWGDRFGKECYVRVVDRETGEWIDAVTAGAYEDWVYTDHGANMDFDEEDRDRIDEDKEVRYEKMMVVIKNPLPRIDLESRGVLRKAGPAIW